MRRVAAGIEVAAIDQDVDETLLFVLHRRPVATAAVNSAVIFRMSLPNTSGQAGVR